MQSKREENGLVREREIVSFLEQLNIALIIRCSMKKWVFGSSNEQENSRM